MRLWFMAQNNACLFLKWQQQVKIPPSLSHFSFRIQPHCVTRLSKGNESEKNEFTVSRDFNCDCIDIVWGHNHNYDELDQHEPSHHDGFCSESTNSNVNITYDKEKTFQVHMCPLSKTSDAIDLHNVYDQLLEVVFEDCIYLIFI